MQATRRRPNTSAPTDGSRTITLRDDQPREEDDDAGVSGSGTPSGTTGILKLRGGPRSRPQVQWDDDVVDNEGAGRKKSKICCIYHKPRPFDESSSDESDSSSDSDDSCDGHHDHEHHHHGHSRRNVPVADPHGDSDGGGSSALREDPSGSSIEEVKPTPRGVPNAYEKQPKGPKGKDRS